MSRSFSNFKYNPHTLSRLRAFPYDRFKIYMIVPIVRIELNSIQAIEVASVVRVVCDRLGSVSIWSSRSSEHFLRRLGRSGRSGRSYGNQALGNKSFFNRFKRSWFVICDWWISIRFVCFCVSRFVACDWRQRKTQLWRRPLNFRDRMFGKSAVIDFITILRRAAHSLLLVVSSPRPAPPRPPPSRERSFASFPESPFLGTLMCQKGA